MKRNWIVAVLFFFTVLHFFGCSKETGTTGNPGLQGTWELFSRRGGITGTPVDYPRGNGNTYVFTQNVYTLTAPGQVAKSGHYQVIQDTSFLLQRPVSKIVFDGQQDNVGLILEVTITRLTLTEDANDGFTYEYRKVLEN